MSTTSNKRLQKRHRAESRFRAYGVLSLMAAATVLFCLVFSIVSKGYTAFYRTTVMLDIELDAERIDVTPPYSRDALMQGRYSSLVKSALYALFPEVTERRERRDLSKMLSPGAELAVRDYLVDHPDSFGRTIALEVPLSSDYDQLYKQHLPRSG